MTQLISHLGALQWGGWFGYGIVAVLVFGESLAFVGFFVPGSLIVILVGGLAAQDVYSFRMLLLVTVAAAIVGNTVSFEMGKYGKGYFRRHPRLWKQIEKGQAFFKKHGGKSVFLGHFLGPVRHAVPVAAGASDMPRLRFQAANIPSAFLWAWFHLAIGFVFGSLWDVALLWSSRIALVLAGLIVILGLIIWFWRWMLRHEEDIRNMLKSFAKAIKALLMGNPTIGGWLRRHGKILRFLRARFSTRDFFGLPFTILAAAFVYTAALLLGIVEDYLTSDTIVAVDTRLANLLYAFRSQTLVHFFYVVTLFASSWVIIPMAMLFIALLWKKRQRILALAFLIAMITGEGTTFVGKLLFQRLRPAEALRAVIENDFSFPSGHATTAAIVYGFIAYIVIRTNRSWTAKVSAFFSAVIAVLLVDCSRLYLGVHYLSDVLAGDLVGLCALIFAISIAEWLSWKRREHFSLPMHHLLYLAAAEVCVAIAVFFFAPSPWTTAVTPIQTPILTNAVPLLLSQGALPANTETLLGTPQEPINLIVIAPKECLIVDLQKAGWRRADSISSRSLRRLLNAALLNQGYATAPMTPSFYDARPHDLGFEKATDAHTVRARHHARFWQTQYATASGAVFVGTVSLDTGIKWAITHTIAPDIDTERNLIAADAETAGIIAEKRDLQIVAPELGKNAAGDAFFTDGKGVMMVLRCSQGVTSSAP